MVTSRKKFQIENTQKNHTPNPDFPDQRKKHCKQSKMKKLSYQGTTVRITQDYAKTTINQRIYSNMTFQMTS